MRSDSTSHTDDDDFVDVPSKSSRKREMHALQALGEELVALSGEQLTRLALPDVLDTAVRAAQGFRMEARRRQLQYIGKLMRKIDPQPIRAMLESFKGNSAVDAARLHRLERLRTDLLDDENTLGRIAESWPGADLQMMRTLRRNALRERETGRPPKAFRELFRVLREHDERHVADGTNVHHLHVDHSHAGQTQENGPAGSADFPKGD